MAKGISDTRYRELIELLVGQRRSLALTQLDLAQRLGTHQQFVSRVETGERRLDVVEFVDYSKALMLDPRTLLDRI